MSNVSRSIIPIFTAVAIFGPTASGQTRSGTAGPEIPDLRKQYVNLVRALFDDSPDQKLIHIGDEQAANVAKGARAILQKGILLLLDSYGNDAAAIKKGINDIQGEYAVPPDAADATNLPFADPFIIFGEDGAAIGYLSADSPYGQPYLEFYTQSNGHWGLRASVGEEYARHSFFVAKLPSPLAGQAWYLVWGSMNGDTGARLALRLYAFDGTSVRTVWKRDGLVRGKVHVSGGQVTLEYEKAYQSNEPRVTEILFVTTNGLE